MAERLAHTAAASRYSKIFSHSEESITGLRPTLSAEATGTIAVSFDVMKRRI